MKHKFLVFALVLTLLLPCLGGSVAYAADSEDLVDISSYVSELGVLDSYDLSSYPYQVIYLDGSSYQYFCSNSPYVINENGLYHGSGSYYWFYLENGNWNLWKATSNPNMNLGFDSIYCSSYDIYDYAGNLVFQKPSEPLGIPREILTQMLIQGNPLNQILTLLPMVIVLLVGYVGLRKALATLQATLRKA